MLYLPSLPYPDDEKAKLAQLETLFHEWHEHFANHGLAEHKQHADEMVFDGFYPYYFSQRKRILFVGREAREIAGFNYIELLSEAYRKGKRIGDQHLNVNNFHSRMLRIAYGILNGMPAWEDIPDASTIGDSIGAPGGLSFAFMNISKLSNETENWESDWPIINAAHKLSSESRTFNEDEVALLEPHYVISMNLNGLDEALGQFTQLPASGQVGCYWLDSGGHRSLFLDSWHFSAWSKDGNKDFYTPFCEAIQRNAIP